ncbi:MAG: hypothetical protein NT049_12175 [Planctomycetota bacterium]|nr:hypothetical protein [Planctomycetota bacterium]
MDENFKFTSVDSPVEVRDGSCKRRQVLLRILATTAAMLMAVLLLPLVIVRYLAWRVASAKTSEEEVAALTAVHSWSAILWLGYSVRFFDQDGVAVRLRARGDMERIVFIEIEWDYGCRTRRRLMQKNLGTLLYE